MGFLEPSPPPFELEEWKAKPHLTRLKPLVQDWGENGFGSPTFVYFIYILKCQLNFDFFLLRLRLKHRDHFTNQ